MFNHSVESPLIERRLKMPKKVVLSEDDYCELFKSLSQDSFKGDNFLGAMRIAKDAALRHQGYQHYMSLSNLKKMISGHSMWLSRLDSRALNDWNESGKYGTSAGWKRSYIGCFSYGRSESAAMWKMYCRPNRNAVRLFVSNKGIVAWNELLRRTDKMSVFPIKMNGDKPEIGKRKVSVKHAGFSDVLYVGRTDDDAGCIRWNGCSAVIEELKDFTKCKGIEGFFKDMPWQYEQETRLFVVLRNEQYNAERLSIDIPKEVFDSMSIVLSPWLPENEVEKKRVMISKWFNDAGYQVPRIIRASQLSGALGAWH